MKHEPPEIDRRLALLLDRTLQGLDPAKAAELDALMVADPRDADPTIELAAAALELARIGTTGHPDLPSDLAARVIRRATRPFPPEPIEELPQVPARPRRRLAPWLGWAAAAASLAVVAFDRANPPSRPPVVTTPPPPDRLAAAPSTRLVATDHPLARGSAGTLAWDGGVQEGTMRLAGLAPVDPRTGCYQLWIFDAARDERYPVDGGIFTVARGPGETVVAVRPRVPVRTPTLFAVTLEPAGGVVVSDRERILLTAAWPSNNPPGPPRP